MLLHSKTPITQEMIALATEVIRRFPDKQNRYLAYDHNIVIEVRKAGVIYAEVVSGEQMKKLLADADEWEKNKGAK